MPGPTSPTAKHAEQAALEAKRYLTRLIESSTDAIISTDKEGKIVLVNEGAEKLLGYQAKDLVGQPVTVVYGSEAAAKEILREMRKRGGTVSGFDCLVRDQRRQQHSCLDLGFHAP